MDISNTTNKRTQHFETNKLRNSVVTTLGPVQYAMQTRPICTPRQL